MRNSFVFYKSYSAGFEWLTAEEELAVRRAIENYALNGAEPEQLTGTSRAVFEVVRPLIDNSIARYEQSVESGKQGGRPTKWIDRGEAEKLYAELGSWDAVAKAMKVSKDTLRKARFAWENGKTKKDEKRRKTYEKPTPKKAHSFSSFDGEKTIEKPTKIQKEKKTKNLNYNVNDNVIGINTPPIGGGSINTLQNIILTDNETQFCVEREKSLRAFPPPRNCEWVSDILTGSSGKPCRMAKNIETGKVGVVPLE